MVARVSRRVRHISFLQANWRVALATKGSEGRNWDTKMFLLGVLCLVATTVALPVLPEPPILPGSSIIVFEKVLHTNVPKEAEFPIEVIEDKKDSNEVEKYEDVRLLSSLPAAPELPPLDVSMLRNIIDAYEEPNKSEEVIKSEAEKSEETKDDELKKEESKEEEPKKEEPKNDEVQVTIDEVKEKPLVEHKKPVIVQWKIPKPSIFSNIISAFPFHIPSFSWPFQQAYDLD